MVYIIASFLVILWIIVLRQINDIAELKQRVLFLLSKESERRYDEKITQDINDDSKDLATDDKEIENTASVDTQVENPLYNPPESQRVYNIPTDSNPIKKADNTERYVSVKPVTIQEQQEISAENWFGRNVIGIVASVLIFIGLILLGVLAYEHITETGKIIAMYCISTVISGLGIGLTLKWRNNFTLILTGCGCGSFFISILLTHVYFGRITDITAFSLLLVWMVATLFLSKKINSTMLSVVAHIGMVISICFAYALALSDEKLIIILFYQAVSIAIILLGNTLLYKNTYNFGILISLSVTVIASLFMWNKFVSGNNSLSSAFASSLPTAIIAITFIVQFLCTSFLSFLLSVSTNRLKSSDAQYAAHFVNKALWITSLIINIFVVFSEITDSYFFSLPLSNDLKHFYALLSAVLITIAVIFCHGAITLILSVKSIINKTLEVMSVYLLSFVMSILLFVLWSYEQMTRMDLNIPHITWLFVVSLLLILVRYITKNKAYLIGANVVLILDALFMFFSGYQELNNIGTVFSSFGYLALYIAIILLQWNMLDSKEKNRHSVSFRLLSFYLVEISLIVIMLSSTIKYREVILLIILTFLNTLLYIIRYDKDSDSYNIMKFLFGFNELILLFVSSFFIAFAHKNPTSTVLYFVLSALCFGLAFIRIRDVYNIDTSFKGIWTGLKLTILVLAVIKGNTTWFEQTYIFSVVCMLTALTCIIFGFIARAKTLRLYGLALTLLCVIKLVTYDVSNLESILRVIAFIGGGIICFIISAMYNYTTKKLAVNDNKTDKSNL